MAILAGAGRRLGRSRTVFADRRGLSQVKLKYEHMSRYGFVKIALFRPVATYGLISADDLATLVARDPSWSMARHVNASCFRIFGV